MLWWWAAAGFLLLALHPFVTYPASLWVGSKLARYKPTLLSPDTPQRVAILFCAYNEEAVIAEKLRNCLEICANDGNAGVYVYADGCSDRTVEITRAFGDQIYLIEGKTRQGKSAGMNELARTARQGGADILFFTDANVLLDLDAIDAMRREFVDASVGCVTGHLDYVNSDESATASVGAQYWSFDSIIKQLETKTGSCVGADGSIFGIRASLFRPVPENIIDDFFTSMSVLCDGWRVVYSLAIVARERSATYSLEEYRRKVRIACRAFNCNRLLWPRLQHLPPWTLYKYASHKLLRWLTAVWLFGAGLALLGGILSLPFSWTVEALLLVLAGLVVLAVCKLPGAPWRHVREAGIAVLATGVGVVKSIQGERFQTWSHAPTTRQTIIHPEVET